MRVTSSIMLSLECWDKSRVAVLACGSADASCCSISRFKPFKLWLLCVAQLLREVAHVFNLPLNPEFPATLEQLAKLRKEGGLPGMIPKHKLVRKHATIAVWLQTC